MQRRRTLRRNGVCARLVLTGAALALSACATKPPAPADAAVLGSNRVVALVSDDAGRTAVRAAAASQGYHWRETAVLGGLDLIMLTFETPPDVTGSEAIAALETAVPASTVGVDHAYRLQQSGGAAALDYADAMMRWPAGGCRALAPVGMIDTGVDGRAPALARTRIVSRAFFDGEAGAARHGTEVAAVLGGPGRLRDATIFSANGLC